MKRIIKRFASATVIIGVEGADYTPQSTCEAALVDGLMRVEMRSVAAFIVDGTIDLLKHPTSKDRYWPVPA